MGIKGGADTVHGGSGQVFVTTGFGVCDVAGVESRLDTDKRLAGFEVSAEARDNGLEYGFRGDTLRCAAGKLACVISKRREKKDFGEVQALFRRIWEWR